MSTAAPRARRLALLAAVPAEACALWMACAADVLPLSFVLAWLVAVMLHLWLGCDGRPVLRARVARPIGAALGAVLLALLARRLGDGGTVALRGILETTCAAQTVLHLAGRGALTNFVGLLLSCVHVAGAGIVAHDAGSLALGCAYVAALAVALLAGERLGSHVAGALPRRALLAPLVRVLLLGFPLGVALYLVAPRSLWSQARGTEPGATAAVRGEAERGEAEAEAEAGRVALTGPNFRVSGVSFGSVAEIQRDLTPWFEVREEGVQGVPRALWLRDNVHDYFHANGSLNDTLSSGRGPRRYLDAHDGVVDGWVPLGRLDDAARGRMLRITVLRGGHRRLYLMPEAVRVQVIREGRALAGLAVERTANETMEIVGEFAAGDEVQLRLVPVPTDDGALQGRRSDTAVCPLGPTYLQLPQSSAAELGRIARQVVGAEADPWRRARRLEAWLKGPLFTYALAVPELDEQDRMLDFLMRARRGHCACYAMSLCLLLRSLGHPTRYVRGFWGGDPQEQHASLLLRGSHYHAWTEMFLDGVGWVPLNPTPPDRTPIDVGTRTFEARARAAAEEPEFSLLDHDAGQWDRIIGAVRSACSSGARRAATVAYGPGGLWVGFWGPVLLGLWIAGSRQRRRERRRLAPGGGSLPRGAYRDALRLLARHGVVRGRAQTLGEFAAQVCQVAPAAGGAFELLTRGAEARLYGQGPAAGAVGLDQQAAALAQLRAALARPR